MNLPEEIKKLLELKEYKSKYGLKPTIDALEKLGNPHKKLKFIHITGTNGKGSTAAYIENILNLAGYKIGLYTSPHLVRFNERIQVNRQEITNEEIVEYINKIKKTGITLTFFEYATIIALMHFFEQKTDYVILEVGLGGKLDATNVVEAEIAIMTNIGLDHTHILGDTIEKITKDKCEIIKQKSKVITCSDNLGLEWIKEKCKQGNELFIAEKYLEKISLLGEYQKKNAGIAYETCKKIGIPEETIKKGIETTKWEGRLEYLEPNVLVDCGHNPAAIKEAARYVNSLNKKIILIFGCMKDKDHETIIKELPKAEKIILTKPKNERAINPEELKFKQEVKIISEPQEAFEYAKKIAIKEKLIFITGSCFLVGNVKESMQKNQ